MIQISTLSTHTRQCCLSVTQRQLVTNLIRSTCERFNAMFYRRSHEPDQLQLCERNGRGLRSHCVITPSGGATSPRGYVASITTHVARCATIAPMTCWQGHSNIESALILLRTFDVLIFCCYMFAVLYNLPVLTVFCYDDAHNYVAHTHRAQLFSTLKLMIKSIRKFDMCPRLLFTMHVCLSQSLWCPSRKNTATTSQHWFCCTFDVLMFCCCMFAVLSYLFVVSLFSSMDAKNRDNYIQF